MAYGKKLSELDASVGDVPDAFYGISGDRSLRYSARQIADYGRPIATTEEAIEGISNELAMTPYLVHAFVAYYINQLPVTTWPEPIENVPVTVEAIHAALVALGLITMTDPAILIATDASGAILTIFDALNNPVTIEE